MTMNWNLLSIVNAGNHKTKTTLHNNTDESSKNTTFGQAMKLQHFWQASDTFHYQNVSNNLEKVLII